MRNKFVSTSTIRSALMLRSTSKAKHSRVYSSVIANHFNGRPAAVRSWIKSQVEWSLCSAWWRTTVTVVTETSLFHALTRHF